VNLVKKQLGYLIYLKEPRRVSSVSSDFTTHLWTLIAYPVERQCCAMDRYITLCLLKTETTADHVRVVTPIVTTDKAGYIYRTPVIQRKKM